MTKGELLIAADDFLDKALPHANRSANGSIKEAINGVYIACWEDREHKGAEAVKYAVVKHLGAFKFQLVTSLSTLPEAERRAATTKIDLYADVYKLPRPSYN